MSERGVKKVNDKVLFVDDEQNILNAIQRQLRKTVNISTALGPENGLKEVKENGPYAVVVSDLRMPVMDGIQFLSRVREISPDTVRMMLTGNADLQAAIQSVNEGNIFRFLTKPCEPDILTRTIDLGIQQYKLITAERELLQETLKGSIKVLTEVLALINPEAFGRSGRIKRYVNEIAAHLLVPEIWRIETAAMLSQIGCVVLPEEALRKVCNGQELTGEESQLFDMHPIIASEWIDHIPRMKDVADIIAYQEKHFDGSGNPRDNKKGEEIPLGSRILKVVLDFDILETKGIFQGRALTELRSRAGWYDPAVVNALEVVLDLKANYEVKEITVEDLRPGMILNQDVIAGKEQLLLARGHEVSDVIIRKLKNFAFNDRIKEPFYVYIPRK